MDGAESAQAAFQGGAEAFFSELRRRVWDGSKGSLNRQRKGAGSAPLRTPALSQLRPVQRPELPNPFSARAESSSSSTASTGPVNTGTGIIWAIFSPAFS